MNNRVFEKMKLIVEWDNKDTYCHEYKTNGCKGCPYDQVEICDTATLPFVLHSSANVFRKYFEDMKK